MESSEAQGIVDARKAQINPAPEALVPTLNPNLKPKDGNWFSKLFRRRDQQPPTSPIQQNKQIGEVAINRHGEAIHGIGDYISEGELRKLEQGGNAGKSNLEPSISTSPFDSSPYRTPDGEFGLKVHSDKVPDPIGTNTVSNPEYDANTAPDNIAPINESVASNGSLPTEPQEEPTTNNQ